MNSMELLDELNQYYQLAVNERINVIKKALFDIIKDLIVMFQDEFLEEIENEVSY